MNPFAQQHADIRQGVRDLCSRFDSSYWQKLEESDCVAKIFKLIKKCILQSNKGKTRKKCTRLL